MRTPCLAYDAVMVDTTHNSGAFTTEPAAHVFAKVAEKLRTGLARKGYNEAESASFLGMLEGLNVHPAAQGVSAQAIEQAALRAIDAAREEAGKTLASDPKVAALRANIRDITPDALVRSIEHVAQSRAPSPLNAERIQVLSERAAKSKPAAAALHVPHGRFGAVDYAVMGVSALTAASSIYSGIAHLSNAKKQAEASGEKASVPFSAYAVAGLQMMIGLGIALIAHHQYTYPIGSSVRG